MMSYPHRYILAIETEKARNRMVDMNTIMPETVENTSMRTILVCPTPMPRNITIRRQTMNNGGIPEFVRRVVHR